MKCKILHESSGRIRLHLVHPGMSLRQADLLHYYLNELESVEKVTVYERTGDVVIRYKGDREPIIRAMARFTYEDSRLADRVPENSGRSLNRHYRDRLIKMVLFRFFRKLFFPMKLQIAYTVLMSLRYFLRGIRCLMKRKIGVEVLDALVIGVSVLRRDFGTAGSVTFLLDLGELLEEWTHKKTVDDLARCMSLNVDRVWKKTDEGEELVPIHHIEEGDRVLVRTGNIVPLDGTVLEGEAMVNQASLTGESIPVAKREGAYVYAGTVVEEGSCVIRAERQSGCGRYDKIVAMIEASEKLKSSTEHKASDLADRLVPYSLLGTAAVWALTGNVTKALAVLMVDFSCALKLAMPLSVLSAMREASNYHITVKGGKYLEAVAKADTIVFDKTGTLTYANPSVAEIIPFGGRDKREVLKAAACLEEHYPHSIANAVVREAERQGILHEETHSQVEYVVAHGISGLIDGKQYQVGSYHFIFEDTGCRIPAEEEETFRNLPEQYSHLYMAVDGELAAVICIFDPLRREVSAVFNSLRRLGIRRIVMMTGDNRKTAAAIAAEIGVDEYYAEVLPEDKARFVEEEKALGRTVIMVGDGVNDSPALSVANVGIAVSDGAAIAREIADITISADSLFELVTLRMLAKGLMNRITFNYRFITGFNAGLIVLGVAGALMPAASAWLHNMSTLAISLKSMTDILGLGPPDEDTAQGAETEEKTEEKTPAGV